MVWLGKKAVTEEEIRSPNFPVRTPNSPVGGDDDGIYKKKSLAQKGKWAEGEVQKFLKSIKARRNDFDFHRLFDAHSAGGRFPAQIADFEYFLPTAHGIIEVKEVKHDFRLPRKNFDPKKFDRICDRERAGAGVWILVHHATTKRWRNVPFEFFEGLREVPSWDLRDFPEYQKLDEFLLYGLR